MNRYEIRVTELTRECAYAIATYLISVDTDGFFGMELEETGKYELIILLKTEKVLPIEIFNKIFTGKVDLMHVDIVRDNHQEDEEVLVKNPKEDSRSEITEVSVEKPTEEDHPETEEASTEETAEEVQPETENAPTEETSEEMQPETENAPTEETSEEVQPETEEASTEETSEETQPEAEEASTEETAEETQPEVEEASTEETAEETQLEVEEASTEETAEEVQPETENAPTEKSADDHTEAKKKSTEMILDMPLYNDLQQAKTEDDVALAFAVYVGYDEMATEILKPVIHRFISLMSKGEEVTWKNTWKKIKGIDPIGLNPKQKHIFQPRLTKPLHEINAGVHFTNFVKKCIQQSLYWKNMQEAGTSSSQVQEMEGISEENPESK